MQAVCRFERSKIHTTDFKNPRTSTRISTWYKGRPNNHENGWYQEVSKSQRRCVGTEEVESRVTENSPSKLIFCYTFLGSVRQTFSIHRCWIHRRFCLASGGRRFWDAGIQLPLHLCHIKKKNNKNNQPTIQPKKTRQILFPSCCTHSKSQAGQSKGKRGQYLEEGHCLKSWESKVVVSCGL